MNEENEKNFLVNALTLVFQAANGNGGGEGKDKSKDAGPGGDYKESIKFVPVATEGDAPNSDIGNLNQEIEINAATADISAHNSNAPVQLFIENCSHSNRCVTLKNILQSFKCCLSEEQAWAMIYQIIWHYREFTQAHAFHIFNELEIPDTMGNISFHLDGSVHCTWSNIERYKKQLERAEKHHEAYSHSSLMLASYKKILQKVGVIVYNALDYNLRADEQRQLSKELEDLMLFMTTEDSSTSTAEESYKVSISDNTMNVADEMKRCENNAFDFVLKVCRNHVKSDVIPEDYYKQICHKLVKDTKDLQSYLQRALDDDNCAHELYTKFGTSLSDQDQNRPGFDEWVHYWREVVAELNRGFELKKHKCFKKPVAYELTPYESLMQDIRSKNYKLRKVMVADDNSTTSAIKDDHTLMLESIKSRPQLKKVSERALLPPLKRAISPHEELMESIRNGQKLNHVALPAVKRFVNRPFRATATASASCNTVKMLTKIIEGNNKKQEKSSNEIKP